MRCPPHIPVFDKHLVSTGLVTTDSMVFCVCTLHGLIECRVTSPVSMLCSEVHCITIHFGGMDFVCSERQC